MTVYLHDNEKGQIGVVTLEQIPAAGDIVKYGNRRYQVAYRVWDLLGYTPVYLYLNEMP